MKAIHVNWTAPFFNKERLRGHGFDTTRNITSSTYDIPDYQLLYIILSALRWKLHNGPIKLYTDSIGLSAYKMWGLLSLYDEVDTDFLDNLKEVDAAYFWTSGKIQALQNEKEPFVFLDQDFIIRGKIPQKFYENDLGIGHWEIPRGYYYFREQDWKKEIKHIDFPKDYNVNAYSPNTSFLYFNNKDIVNEYVSWHKKLIKTEGQEVPEWFWLATDQGILGHVIREGNYNTNTLTDKVFLADSDYGNKGTRYKGLSEQWYYPQGADLNKGLLEWEHVWLAKVVFKSDKDFEKAECQRYYDEIHSLGGKNYLYNLRLFKYWNEEKHGDR
jgi:hypothetical protein